MKHLDTHHLNPAPEALPDYHVLAAAARREQSRAIREAAIGLGRWLRSKARHTAHTLDSASREASGQRLA